MSRKNRNYCILRIIYTSVFLIFTTFYWYYNLKDVNALTVNDLETENISFNNLEKVANENISNLKTYKIKLETNESRKVKIFIVPSSIKLISNNYIKYQINEEGINSLNMDGLIYLDDLIKDETRELNLKIWISDTYQGTNTYSGNIVII